MMGSCSYLLVVLLSHTIVPSVGRSKHRLWEVRVPALVRAYPKLVLLLYSPTRPRTQRIAFHSRGHRLDPAAQIRRRGLARKVVTRRVLASSWQSLTRPSSRSRAPAKARSERRPRRLRRQTLSILARKPGFPLTTQLLLVHQVPLAYPLRRNITRTRGERKKVLAVQLLLGTGKAARSVARRRMVLGPLPEVEATRPVPERRTI
mmetsp:Transcript_14019/g.28279  ORF Transcript_14019/g.28279 Transcript_14019/m.28279 type:complete len:205 (+) Transcript_14019:3-617(+)